MQLKTHFKRNLSLFERIVGRPAPRGAGLLVTRGKSCCRCCRAGWAGVPRQHGRVGRQVADADGSAMCLRRRPYAVSFRQM